MTPLQIHTALRNALAAAFPTTPTAWPNEPFDPTGKATWMRPAFRPGESFPGEFSGDDKRTGSYKIQVFTPEGSGAGAALNIAGQIEAAFRWKSFGGVECMAPYSSDPQEDAGGGPWFMCVVTIPWWAWA